MAPSFLKDLRRRSRASFRTDRSTDASSDGAGSQGTTPSSGSMTPPSIAQQSDPALNLQLKDLAGAPDRSVRQRTSQPHLRAQPADSSQSQSETNTQVPTRPPLTTSNANRNSVSGMSGLGSPSVQGRQNLPVSQYSPVLLNLNENTWVYQKILLVHGTIGDPKRHSLDGTLTVAHLDDIFPPIDWPVCNSHFKAVIYLHPGPNRLRFDFSSPKLANSSSPNPIHVTYRTVHMMPMLNAPPLQLAILLGKDSPGTYDVMPARGEKEGNGLEMAIKKFRMAAYLWQAFTAEHMRRQGLARRAFRFEEEWMTGTSTSRDELNSFMRSEAKIHIIHCDKTVAELRDLEKAQQNTNATQKDALFDITMGAVKNYFQPRPGQKLYVSALLLDAHWDTETKTVTGHAALGGGDGNVQLAVFGSHCLHSYPSNFEDVVSAFTDCTPTDTQHVANDCNQAGSSWEAANIGIGGHLHETGHLFGCPHQMDGVMLRDYVVLNRSFVAREAYCTRTKSKGGLAWLGDECAWHRLDCLRFRAHPAFRLPNEPTMSADGSVQAFPTGGGNVLATSASGISFVEIFGEGKDACQTWIEFPLDPILREVHLNEQDLRSKLPEHDKKGRLRISIKSHGGGSLDIDDYKQFTSKETAVKLPNGKIAFKSHPLGSSQMDGSQPEMVIFDGLAQNKVLSQVLVYHGSAVDGLEFIYDDGSSQLFGKRGGNAAKFDLDIRRGETISGFFVRCGFWIDAIQIFTTQGRRSSVYGNANGGSGHMLLPPRGFVISGISGSCGQWLDGFSILITR